MKLVHVAFAFVIIATASPSRLPAEEPAKGLEGKWEITSQRYNGGPGFACPGSSMTFTKDQMFWMRAGKRHSYNYTTDAKAKPKRIDLLALDEPFKGQTFEAIFEVDGDTLRINMGGTANIKRPTEFGSEKEKGPRHWAFSLKRVKE
jgi:uncharacterized protein (TIGR03067 family)